MNWIPVTEALPDDECAVLIAFADGDVYAGQMNAGKWRSLHGAVVYAADAITHWAHMPEGPKDQYSRAMQSPICDVRVKDRRCGDQRFIVTAVTQDRRKAERRT